MRGRTAALLLLSTALSGCVISVESFYSNSDLLFDPSLVGTWGDPAGTEYVVVTERRVEAPIRWREAGGGSYSLVFTSAEGKKSHFIGHLTRLDGLTLMDIGPAEPQWDVDDGYRSLFVAAHTLMLVEHEGSAVKVAFLNVDTLKHHLRTMPRPLSHTQVDDRLVLTSPTSELRRFLAEYLKKEGAFDEADLWVRR